MNDAAQVRGIQPSIRLMKAVKRNVNKKCVKISKTWST